MDVLLDFIVECASCHRSRTVIFEGISAKSETRIAMDYWAFEQCPRCFLCIWSLTVRPSKKPAAVVESNVSRETVKEEI